MDYDLLIETGGLSTDRDLPSYIVDVGIKACAPEWAEDYPAATKRLIQRSEGIAQTIVNGKVVYEDGKLSGEMAGTVLRATAYQARP
jgi:N-acyl-D-aspartate/D-glutamate deacylase